MGVYDAIDDGEAEPGAARPGREEWISRARAHLRVHPFSGVDDVHREAVRAFVGHCSHADRQHAARPHRLHRVVDQIVEYLSQEIPIAPDSRLGGIYLEFDRDALAAREKRERSLEELAKRNVLPLHVDGARIAQQVRDEPIEAGSFLLED